MRCLHPPPRVLWSLDHCGYTAENLFIHAICYPCDLLCLISNFIPAVKKSQGERILSPHDEYEVSNHNMKGEGTQGGQRSTC